MSQFLEKVFAISGFNLVKLSLFLSKFQCNFHLVKTWFTLTKEWLALTKERFVYTKSPF